MRDFIVIGCGIVGATITAALRLHGFDVQCYDDRRPLAGTPPSGGHLKPSWFGGMPKSEYEPAMELLNELWGLKEERFLVRGTAGLVHTTVYRVDTDQVVRHPRRVAKVMTLHYDYNHVTVIHEHGEEQAKKVVIAAGIWCKELLPDLKITEKRGVSFRVQTTLKEPFIKPWAPYKQVVAHQQTPIEAWVGDGSTIIPKNWGSTKVMECQARCLEALGGNHDSLRSTFTVGTRPYCESGKDPCLYLKLNDRAVVVTGAGKSGTIAAGWAARRFLREV